MEGPIRPATATALDVEWSHEGQPDEGPTRASISITNVSDDSVSLEGFRLQIDHNREYTFTDHVAHLSPGAKVAIDGEAPSGDEGTLMSLPPIHGVHTGLTPLLDETGGTIAIVTPKGDQLLTIEYGAK